MTVREFCVGGDGCSSRREFPGNVKKPKKASTPSASSLQPPAEVGIITSSSSVKKSMPSESKETMKKDNDISGIPRNVMEALATKSIPSLAGSLSARLGVDLSVAPAASPKTKKKKKKKGSSSSAAAVVPSVSKTSDSTHGTGGHQPHHHSHHNNHLDAAVFHGQRNSGKNEEDIWFHSDAAEKQRIREFWLHLSEDDRRALVKLEKEAVLKKMKEQQRTSCSCDICGRKKSVIEEELEILYDAYYEELENFANDQGGSRKGLPQGSAYQQLHSSHNNNNNHPSSHQHHHHQSNGNANHTHTTGHPNNSQHSTHASPPLPFPLPTQNRPKQDDGQHHHHHEFEMGMEDFGNNLTVKGGILTVADDFLKNDGQKFLSLMEELASRRIRPIDDEDDKNGEIQSDEEDWDDVYEEDDEEEYDDEEEETLSEQQRMVEGRRMFQIFAAKMFEQRVLTAYREKVAQERQRRLLEEIEEEERQKDLRDQEKERKKAQKKAAKKQKEDDKLAQERKKKEEEDLVVRQKEEAERKRREAEQARKDAEAKKAADLERARLVAEGRKRDKELKAQRLAEERRLEKEKKEAALKLQREQEEQERLLKKKEKEEKLKLAKKERKERKAREKQEQEEREAREAAAAAEAARQKQEQDELRRQRLESERQAFYQRQQQEQLQRVAAQVAVHQGGLEGLTGSTAVPSRNSSVEYSHTHADSSIPSSPRDFVKPLPHQSHSSDYLPSLRAQQMPVSQQSAYPMPNGMLQSTILQHRQHSRQAHLRQLSQPAQPLRGAPDVFSTASSSLLESILVPNAPNQGMSSMQASSQRPQSTGASETSSPLLNPPGLLAPQGAPMSTSYRSSNSNEMLANPSAPLSGLAGIGGPSLLSAHSLIGQNSQSSLMSELPSQSSLLGGLGQTPASSSLRPAPIQRPLRVAEPSHSKDIGLPHLLNDEVTLRLSGLYDESDEVIVDSKPGNPLLSDLNHQRSWNSVLDPSPMSHSPTGVPDGLSSRPILSNANSIGGSHSLGFEGRLWSKPSQVPASNPPVQLNQHQPPQVMTHQQFMQMQSAGGSFSGVATGNATKGLNGQNTGFSPLGMSYGTDAGLSAQSLSQQGQTQDQQQPQSNPLAPSSSASTWTSSRFF